MSDPEWDALLDLAYDSWGVTQPVCLEDELLLTECGQQVITAHYHELLVGTEGLSTSP